MDDFHAEELLVLSSSMWSYLQFPSPKLEDSGIKKIPGKVSAESPFGKFMVDGRPVFIAPESTLDKGTFSSADILRMLTEAHEQGIVSCILIGTATPIRPKKATFVIVSDHINLLGCNPLVGKNKDDNFNRFPDMSQVYDPGIQSRLIRNFGSASDEEVGSGIMVGIHDDEQLDENQRVSLKNTGECCLTRELVLAAIAAHSIGLKVGSVLVSLGKETGKTRAWIRKKVALAIRITVRAVTKKKT